MILKLTKKIVFSFAIVFLLVQTEVSRARSQSSADCASDQICFEYSSSIFAFNDGKTMDYVETLEAGTKLSIPKKFARYKKSGEYDMRQSLLAWLQSPMVLQATENNKTELMIPIQKASKPGLTDDSVYYIRLSSLTKDATTLANEVKNKQKEKIYRERPPSMESDNPCLLGNCITAKPLEEIARAASVSYGDKMKNLTSAQFRERFKASCGISLEEFYNYAKNRLSQSSVDIPLKTLFGVMTVESDVKCKGPNANEWNGSVSRGLFQLNSSSVKECRDQKSEEVNRALCVKQYSDLQNPKVSFDLAVRLLEEKNRALKTCGFDTEKMNESDRSALLLTQYKGGGTFSCAIKDRLKFQNNGEFPTSPNWEQLQAAIVCPTLDTSIQKDFCGKTSTKARYSSDAFDALKYVKTIQRLENPWQDSFERYEQTRN